MIGDVLNVVVEVVLSDVVGVEERVVEKEVDLTSAQPDREVGAATT